LLTRERKDELIQSFATRPGDTGSPEVQVAVLTERIKYLTTHLKANKHDYHTRRGLLMLVGQRRRQLRYLNRRDVNRYRDVIARLGLRK
jgi:small subunit ribosomal protein S15